MIGDDRLDALRTSVERLRRLVEPMDDEGITAPAYPSEWTIAQVLSHLGSGAVITRRSLDDVIAGTPTPEAFTPSVWDAWNGKSLRAQADDALAADAELMTRLQTVTDDERSRFSFSLGPLTLDFEGFVGLRLNEHALHTWDIQVAGDPDAILPPDPPPSSSTTSSSSPGSRPRAARRRRSRSTRRTPIGTSPSRSPPNGRR